MDLQFLRRGYDRVRRCHDPPEGDPWRPLGALDKVRKLTRSFSRVSFGGQGLGVREPPPAQGAQKAPRVPLWGIIEGGRAPMQSIPKG